MLSGLLRANIGEGGAAERHDQNAAVRAEFGHGGVDCAVDVGIGVEKDFPDKFGIKIGDEKHFRPLQHHGDSGCLVPAKDEILRNFIQHIAAALVLDHPSFEHIFAQPFAAGGDQNDNAVIAHSEIGIVQRFLRLVEIEILGVAAGGRDDNISLFGNRRFVNCIDMFDPFALGLDKMPGDCVKNVLFFRQE